ncbi:conserved hypothetical protein [Hyella patelloides LEGE 07179]|uniref:Uncharacterized protein n=1 Tax=Hyella patelloides LEGE 07179 TaxID=945734 RepID=A0A563W5W2_9CYAN|nr:hypothetical protein [Hyella patelloides]VEP18933.1 conserved hypothetical protein [Hyella patelloides LEGE 07179]
MTNFKEMSLKDLTNYVLAHRDDQSAWDEYVSRPRTNATRYPAPKNQKESDDQFEDFLRKQGKTI